MGIKMKKMAFLCFLIGCAVTVLAQEQTKTYAEMLGWPKGARVIILHVDDAGMSHESDEGVEESAYGRGFHFYQCHDALSLGSGDN